MGQARKRGTFEQRVEQARDAFHEGIEVKKQEIAEMDKLEQRQLAAMGTFLATQVLPGMERQYGALMRTDFSNVPMPLTRDYAEEVDSTNETL